MNINNYWNFSASYPCLCVGNYVQSAVHGLFYVSKYDTSNVDAHFGCRLMEI